MARFRIPKAKTKPKDYSVLPWTEAFRLEYPVPAIKKLMQEQEIPIEKLVNYLHFHAYLDRNKAELLKEAIAHELTLVHNDQEVNLVINIPFCAWRCFNCTNVMYDKTKNKDIYPYFIDALYKELNQAKQIIENKYYMVNNICFTGNLLALDEEEIESLLKMVSYQLSNITIELGAPAFVTEQKLQILKKYNVTRIIINELTFNTVTLRKLGRRFEFKDFYNAYKLIIGYGFETSFELVVGLQDEKELQLARNLKLATELGASNIDLFSVHCPNITEPDVINAEHIKKQRQLLDFANKYMLEKGFKPYFVKCTEIEKGCFENVGWTIENMGCRFMKDKMEHVSTTIGCGTQSQSVLVHNIGNKKAFMKNPYDISLYVFGIDELLAKKEKFFA